MVRGPLGKASLHRVKNDRPASQIPHPVDRILQSLVTSKHFIVVAAVLSSERCVELV